MASLAAGAPTPGDAVHPLVYSRRQEMTVTLLSAIKESRFDVRAPGAADGFACAFGMMIIMTGHPPRERTRAP